MEAFINKMRRLKGVRKQLIVEEAWKALSSANMAEYLRYMYKTVRKYYGRGNRGDAGGDDIISSPVVKESIINNSDCKILLDQRKYMNKFDQIQALLGLTEKEKSQILSINMANNPSRLYKEVWIGWAARSRRSMPRRSARKSIWRTPRGNGKSGGLPSGGEAGRRHRSRHPAACRKAEKQGITKKQNVSTKKEKRV
ncbi:TraG/VirB4 family ATPase [Bacteroides salyersiae]|uniref:TraG/VirB4 family ATPase n=1 Tax=Bacteroides salyersiae TaxID=291644 RepID=UPI003743254B